MKTLTVAYKDIVAVRFTVTPERITIKAPLNTTPTMMETYTKFLMKVANEGVMLNCTKSFRGQLNTANNKFEIIMYSDTKKESYRFEGE